MKQRDMGFLMKNFVSIREKISIALKQNSGVSDMNEKLKGENDMEEFYVLKDINNGKYYSDDKEFVEPNKRFAKRLRRGQAKALQWELNRWSNKPNIIIESAE